MKKRIVRKDLSLCLFILIAIYCLSPLSLFADTYSYDLSDGNLYIWDLSGTYTDHLLGMDVIYDITHDEKGKLVGSVDISGYDADDDLQIKMTLNLKGTVKQKNGVAIVKMTLTGKGTAEDDSNEYKLSYSKKITGTINPDSLTIEGEATEKVSIKGFNSFKETFDFSMPLPPVMDGSSVLSIEVNEEGKKLVGTSTLELSNSRTFNFDTIGKYNPKKNATKLKLKGSGCKIKLEIGDDSSLLSIKGAVLGQKLSKTNTSTSSFESNEFKILPSNGSFNTGFGYSVSISGDYAIMGDFKDEDNGADSGAAYIFERSGSNWIQMDKLTANDGAADDWFGVGVSISGDYAIVGAGQDDDNGNKSGSAYIFERSSSSWVQMAKLTASDAAAGDWFGEGVSISGDYAIVGARLNDNDSGQVSGCYRNFGSAYIFERSGSSWLQMAKLTASDGASNEDFGYSVSISGDYAIVGAGQDDDNGEWSGSAYIFERSGSNWIQMAKLTANDGAALDRFGYSVSISGDYATVGSLFNYGAGEKSGSAYIFERSGSNWIQMAKLTASDGAYDDRFGRSVSISGNYAIVGAKYDDDNGEKSGSAYIFERSGSSWIQRAKLTASDGAHYDLFGLGVSISGDYAIAGSIVAAYIYDLNGVNGD